MSSNDNNHPQQVKGVVENNTRVRDGGVINNGSNESQIINNQKSDEHILFASQQQQQQFYHHPQGAPQQYTMYPSGVTYSIDPSQAGTNQVAGLDYTMLQPQQIYQLPVYYSPETFHPQQGYEDPYQTSTSTQFQSIIGGQTAAGAGGGAAAPSQQHQQQQYHIQTAQYSGAGAEQQQQNYMQQQQQQENISQGIIYPKAANATMFDNTAAKYTADWVSRTTLIPSEMKVPPDQAAIDLISHDSKVITPKNWGDGSYVVTTSSAKPIASATVDHQPLLDQQLAQLDINTFPFVSSHLSQPQQQQHQQIQGGLGGGGYALNWPGTSQQQQQPQQQIYRDQNIRAYNTQGGPPKTQATSWADITKRGTNNNNNNNRPQYGGGGGGNNYQDQQRGTQSAQPVIIHSQIRHERSFTGPKTTFNQTGANNPGSFVRNVNRHSGNNFGNRGNMPRPNNNNNNNMGNRSGGGGPPRQQQQQSQNNFSSFSAPPPQQHQQQQQRGLPLPSLLAQHRTQNFPRNNFGGGGGQQRGQQGNTFGFTSFGGGQQHSHQQQMPEFNPGVPPPALPTQFRHQQQQPMPPMMPPPFPPPPFNMMNPQQQQQFFRAFISQVRPDAMMPPPGPYGFDQFGHRFFNPGYPFGPPSSIPPYGSQFNRYPNFAGRGQRRGGGRGGNRFQQPRRNYQDQSSKYYSNNTQNNQQQHQQTSSNQDSKSKSSPPLDSELADSVNRGVEFDRDETKTPEPKGDTETTGSPNEDNNKKDSPSKDDDEEEEDLVVEDVDGEVSPPPPTKNTTTVET
uniref:Enamelin n=1 Tax=Panagrolaimus sp. ES5 TaxID=591445 RepID=A0AC34GRZ8_9BILA